MGNDLTIEIPGEAVMGMGIRLFFLGTHYSKPIDFTQDKLDVAIKIWRRWIQKAEPTHDVLPVEFLEALCDDMNTAKAIALMHGYYKQKAFGALFNAMKFLGLIPNIPGTSISDLEIKTVPPEDAAMIEGLGVLRS